MDQFESGLEEVKSRQALVDFANKWNSIREEEPSCDPMKRNDVGRLFGVLTYEDLDCMGKIMLGIDSNDYAPKVLDTPGTKLVIDPGDNERRMKQLDTVAAVIVAKVDGNDQRVSELLASY